MRISKKVILLFVAATVLITVYAYAGWMDSTFKVKVSGTEGLNFSGSLMVVTSGGKSTSKSVDGVIPAEYELEGLIVSVSFQKMSESGDLKVEIIKDEKVVAESETSAQYGVVAVASQ